MDAGSHRVHGGRAFVVRSFWHVELHFQGRETRGTAAASRRNEEHPWRQKSASGCGAGHGVACQRCRRRTKSCNWSADKALELCRESFGGEFVGDLVWTLPSGNPGTDQVAQGVSVAGS